MGIDQRGPVPVPLGLTVKSLDHAGQAGRARRAGLGHRGQFGLGGALHGEFVVKKEGGAYQTVATQRGEVTAVSKDSITVKSEDGYSRTYAITEDTLVNAARDGIDDVKTGNTSPCPPWSPTARPPPPRSTTARSARPPARSGGSAAVPRLTTHS